MVEEALPGDFTAGDIPGAEGQKFDLVIVDVLADRITSALAGLPFLTADSVLLWDNTDVRDWPKIKAMMSSRGFR